MSQGKKKKTKDWKRMGATRQNGPNDCKQKKVSWHPNEMLIEIE